jgi:outer membrane murein-binding lipoprotein Lpp
MDTGQQPTGGAQNSQTKEWYKNWWGAIIALCILPIFAIWYIWAKTNWGKTLKITLTVVVAFFTLVAIAGNSSNTDNNQTSSQPQQTTPAPTQEASNQNATPQALQATDTPAQNNTPAPPTDQPSLEKYLASIISMASPDMSYKNLEVQKSDPDRPKGTQAIAVNIDVKNFSDKDALLKTTGKLSSSIYQAVFSVPSMKAYDVIVFYSTGLVNAPTDRYGNKLDGGISYSIDKLIYDKINWQNFDQTTLCDFLKKENSVPGNSGNTACIMLGNVQ